MPAKVNIAALLRKHLGKEVADAMAAKVDKMVCEHKSVMEIETVLHEDLSAHSKKVANAIMDTIRPPQFPPTGGPPHKGRK